MEAFADLATWPVRTVAAAALRDGEVVATHGPVDHVFDLASVTKPLAAWATLVAAEEGIVALDEPLDERGMTLRHLLAHAGGLPFEGHSPVAEVGRRRIYSNTGYEVIERLVTDASGMPFAHYLHEAVAAPLGMQATELAGTAAAGGRSTVADLSGFVAELVHPRLLAASTAAEATTVNFPGLAGVVPGVGRFDPCDWGLGLELKGAKRPHWMGTRNTPQAYGHFGGAGTFVWVDVGEHAALVVLTDRPFAHWADQALRLWPALSDAVLAELSGTGPHR